MVEYQFENPNSIERDITKLKIWDKVYKHEQEEQGSNVRLVCFSGQKSWRNRMETQEITWVNLPI